MATPVARAVRVHDDVWEAAMAAAKERGEPLSVAINRFLREYAGLEDRVNA